MSARVKPLTKFVALSTTLALCRTGEPLKFRVSVTPPTVTPEMVTCPALVVLS